MVLFWDMYEDIVSFQCLNSYVSANTKAYLSRGLLIYFSQVNHCSFVHLSRAILKRRIDFKVK